MTHSDSDDQDESWREELHDGQYLDAKDTAKMWCEAVVIKHAAKKVHIHFRGWGTNYNEWIPRESKRLAPAYTHVENWRVLHKGDAVQVGTMMLGKTIPVWHNATVTQVRHSDKKKGGVPAQVQVELDGVGEKRWVDAQDDLLCRAATHNVAQVLKLSGEKKMSPVNSTNSNGATAKKRKRLTTMRGGDDSSDDDDDADDVATKLPWYDLLKVGSLLEVADDDMNHWYEARVVCERPSKISVRFRGWPWKFDEWVSRDSERLAPLHTNLGNWRAFVSFGYVKIGFRKSMNQDAASHWVLGHVVKKFKNKLTHEVGRVEIKWKDEDGNEHSDERDVEDDFLAPEGVPTFPPMEPPDDASDSDGSDERDRTTANRKQTDSDDEPEAEEEEEEDELEEEEAFEIETSVEEEQQPEPLDGDTTASTVSDGQSEIPATERVETGDETAKSAKFAESISQLKGKIKEDLVEMYNRAMRAHIAMIDALEWSVASHTTAETQTEPQSDDARPAKRRTRASRGRDDDRQHVWKGLAPASKNTPAHL